MPTTPRQFRLADETLSLMDAVGRKLGLPSRADVIRVAVTRLAESESVTTKQVRTSRKKTEKSV